MQSLRPIVEASRAQTRAHLLGGDTHVPDKVLGVFEPHTEAIRKGEIRKAEPIRETGHHPEAEHQIVTAFEVHTERPQDIIFWTAALDRHQATLWACARSGRGQQRLRSATNERAAEDRGVRRVVFPPPRIEITGATPTDERQRWFRRGQRWRTGCEGRISVLKRRHGMRRCSYRGRDGVYRWVGLGVIADNLINIATVLDRRSGGVTGTNETNPNQATGHVPDFSRTANARRPRSFLHRKVA